MDQALPENPQRRVLTIATAAMGGVGLAAAAIPFVESMMPSERALAAGAPAEVDLSRVTPGTLFTAEWRGKPVWVLHRTPGMLASLKGHDALLADPLSLADQQPFYASNPFRSIKPEYFVATAICTHLGCVPSFRPEPGSPELGETWPGGFYCPCHGSKFDLAGRVFRNVPAPRNLEVPPHQYASEAKLVIGVDPGETA